MRRAACLFAAIQLTACAVDDDGEVITPELGGGKGDALDQVDDRGALEPGVARTGSFAEDLEFHGYRFAVRPGTTAQVMITQLGTSKKLDTTLFVYGPSDAGAFGTEAIAFDDDSGWGKQPRLDALALTEGGEYLIVVGTHDARGRGNYRLQASCDGECSPVPEPAGCDELVANNILACVGVMVDDAAADPERPDLDRSEAMDICTDGEALGPVFDALCGHGNDREFCASGFDHFAQSMGPVCRDDLDAFTVECVFGREYRDALTTPALEVDEVRVISSADGLSALEREQLVAAVQATGNTSVTTVEAAFEAADDGRFNRTELAEAAGARSWVVYEYGAGDTSIGAFFDDGGTAAVAVISDGFLQRCSAGT
ncbi:MAG: hypothetical protein IAG13_08155 [Deltaproteobacteria bacterium]|nr:hypothetical protein [Nannocystaceae bacterium]